MTEGEAMPGDISDSYDPEFGTGSNADAVRAGVSNLVEQLDRVLGDKLDIATVALGPDGNNLTLVFSERELRLMRFALSRAIETI